MADGVVTLAWVKKKKKKAKLNKLLKWAIKVVRSLINAGGPAQVESVLETLLMFLIELALNACFGICKY